MFIIFAAAVPKEKSEKNCLLVLSEELSDLWHKRFGHLSNQGIQMLMEKEMVDGLGDVAANEGVCEICCKGKQS